MHKKPFVLDDVTWPFKHILHPFCFCFMIISAPKTGMKNSGDLNLTKVCWFYSLCSEFWRSITFYCFTVFLLYFFVERITLSAEEDWTKIYAFSTFWCSLLRDSSFCQRCTWLSRQRILWPGEEESQPDPWLSVRCCLKWSLWWCGWSRLPDFRKEIWQGSNV
jgi:hypothetical protein